jgi:hypothetical protein
LTDLLKGLCQLKEDLPNPEVESTPKLPKNVDPNTILVTGFDDDTKEEELIAYFYRLVYGGGTRNINDGKVHSC